jgi:molybdopterin converting factor small subunit
MGRITFTANLQRHLPAPEVSFTGGTVRAALDEVFAANPRLRSYIVDEQGRLRQHVNVFINDRPVEDRSGLSDPLSETDEVYVLQALSGG